MKITNYTEIEKGWYAFVCPLCGRTFFETPKGMMDIMPEFAICDCDRFEEDRTMFRIFERNGKMFIERLKFPRFVGEITFGSESDIENVEMLDECDDVLEIARAMRSAAEFMLKCSRRMTGR